MRHLFLFLLVSISAIAHAQITTFQRTFPTVNEEFTSSIVETTDHNFLLGGITSSYGAGMQDGLIMLTDSSGIARWSNSYGDNLNQHILDVYAEDANNIFFTGYTESSINGEQTIFGKIDGSGTLLWVNAYGGSGDESARKILRDNQGDFYLFGSSTSGFAGAQNDVYVIKTKSDGTLIWAKAYGAGGDEKARSAEFTAGGDIIIVGSTDGSSATKDGMVLKIDTSGAKLWTRRYESPKAELIQGIVIDVSGNILVTGFTKMNLNYASSYYNPFLMKLDNTGNQDWLMIYEDSVQTKGFSIAPGQGGGYIIAADGYDVVAESDTMNCFYIKTNDNGNVLWSKKVGGTGDEWRPKIIPTNDGGYIAATSTTTFTNDTMNNVYLIKMDQMGVSGCNTFNHLFNEIDTSFVEDTVSFLVANGGTEASLSWTTNSAGFVADTICENIVVGVGDGYNMLEDILIVYPNPTSGLIVVELDKVNEAYYLEIIDMNGRLVLSELLDINFSSKSYDLGVYGNGLYLIKVHCSDGIDVVKIIVE